MKKIDFVKPSLDIKDNIKAKKVLDDIKEKLKDVQDLDKYKNDINFLSLVCNLIENSISNRTVLNCKKKRTVDKKESVSQIMTMLFSDDSEEYKKEIESNIEYLHHNKLIKKVSMGLVTAYYVANWVQRKLL